ncbi:MAG: sigma-70 family RNA polymerase sigma factor [Anaerolineae bacterium]|nr:sigma-70 family RNA polymerase sigma factor [Anaerolineae bacterium]
MTPDIRRAIERAQKGDTAAVAALYQTFAPAIYRYIAYRVSADADAEDLTAEVFLKMVEGLPRYRITDAPFEAWLYRIAAARIIDFRRRQTRRPQVPLSEHMTDSTPTPEAQVQHNQEFRALRAALAQLNDEHQTILILRFVERKSHEETAAIMGKSVSAVKSAQHRALSKLAEWFGAEQKARHYLRGGA